MIIKTISALKEFCIFSDCEKCKEEAREILKQLQQSGVELVQLNFDTECEHGG